MDAARDPTTPLWRAAQVFRLLSYAYALYFHATISSDLEHPTWGWVLFGVVTAWSLVCGIAYLQGFGRRPAWVITEVLVVVVLILSTALVASDRWVVDNQSLPTTLWATNATISAAILAGPAAGMTAAVVLIAAYMGLKGQVDSYLGSATIVVQLSVGLALGMAAQTARRAHADLERAVRLSAALEERERLSRTVHDGVIQVLALVTKRGREIGGEAAELAVLASEQERALRRLISSPAPVGPGALVDLRGMLARRESDRVSVSLPGTAVEVDSAMAEELDAAVGNALDNVVAHAGSGARAFVLLEDLGDNLTISVRDNGGGIPAGRLDQAVGEGRAGISKSIVGRLHSLGGSATLCTDDSGTEWELTVPRGDRRG